MKPAPRQAKYASGASGSSRQTTGSGESQASGTNTNSASKPTEISNSPLSTSMPVPNRIDRSNRNFSGVPGVIKWKKNGRSAVLGAMSQGSDRMNAGRPGDGAAPN